MSAHRVGPCVALAEDDPEFRIILSEILLVRGYDVKEAADGIELWRWIERGGVDLVITDLLMPRRRGDEVLRHCRARGDTTPFIVMTTQIDWARRLAGLPAVQIVAKPFTLDVMLTAIRGALAGVIDSIAATT
ncbi:MAG TPA: response regulator [Kofleriaceae bacterium]|nr:response regulator [Kofleriaceae bacterium]